MIDENEPKGDAAAHIKTQVTLERLDGIVRLNKQWRRLPVLSSSQEHPASAFAAQ
jgi:hypothetical protein